MWVTVIFKAWFLNISYCFLYCVQNIFSFGFIKAFDSKQIRARTCKDCVISREINTLLKMAVFGKSCWNVDTRKMLRSALKRDFFWFYRSVGFEGNIKYFKKRNYISHGVRWPCSFHFCYMTNEIAHFVSLQSLFLQKLLSWMYLQFGEYFLWVWASEANFLAVFSKRVSRFQEKLNIFWGKQELARTCSVCVNTGGKPNRSKISRG